MQNRTKTFGFTSTPDSKEQTAKNGYSEEELDVDKLSRKMSHHDAEHEKKRNRRVRHVRDRNAQEKKSL
jgi:hypothetical protein